LENVEYSLGDVVKSFSIVEVGVAEWAKSNTLM
jgi:hypothetical protein